ncbi:CDP-alcohol phosphatidyltransferase family protein [Spirillospora sp. NBC_01491]|uniref:CDP-alcohol phosphatidyltransferase family protein n=1 Tax=Spirillospora sp. NBC_01491 TaxID=2976007 RepID=UPI002E2FCBD3|nr:CDP-alcohol phosphatidyltransferase family protein [Spirillospora sp. NBC_01491]
MTIAVIIATGRTGTGADPVPTAVLPCGDGPEAPTVLTRLCDQLATLKVPERRIVTRPDLAPALRKDGHDVIECEDTAADLREIARLTRGTTAPVVLLPGDLVANGELLSRLLVDARTVPVAGTAPGLLRVGRARVETLAELAERLAVDLFGGPPGDRPAAVPKHTAELLRLGLARDGVPVAPCPGEGLVCVRAGTEDAALAALAEAGSVDEDRIRMDAAINPGGGPVGTRTAGRAQAVTRWAAREGLTPNTVTLISLAVGLLAALWFAAGTRTGMVVGAVLFYLAFVLDCVDGQLARYRRMVSPLGAWMDAIGDRAKEYAVYAGLAVGAAAAPPDSSVHAGSVWGLAVAAMALQTVRHMVDSSGLESAPAPPPLDGRAGWAQRLLTLPIGERFALISVTAALGNARMTFAALLAWGSVAALYSLVGRIARAVAR